MAKLSNMIESFLKDMLREAKTGTLEIQRNELAQKFECAPSQINYVLATRFTSERGYYIESKRGGGGYIKIVKININDDIYIKNLVLNIIGNSITVNNSRDLIDEFQSEGVITDRESRIMKSAISSRLIPSFKKGNELRADIIKNMLLVLTEK